MYAKYVLPFRQYIVINVIACTLGEVHYLSSPIFYSLSLWPCVLFPPPAPFACNEMLWNVGRCFHPIVSWRGAVPGHGLSDLIDSSYMNYDEIQGVLSRCINDILLSHMRVRPTRVVTFIVVQAGMRPVLLGWRLLRRWSCSSPVHRYNIAYVIFVDGHCRWCLLIMLNGQALADSSLLYNSVSTHSAADIVIGGCSRYNHCLTSILFDELHIRLS